MKRKTRQSRNSFLRSDADTLFRLHPVDESTLGHVGRHQNLPQLCMRGLLRELPNVQGLRAADRSTCRQALLPFWHCLAQGKGTSQFSKSGPLPACRRSCSSTCTAASPSRPAQYSPAFSADSRRTLSPGSAPEHQPCCSLPGPATLSCLHE